MIILTRTAITLFFMSWTTNDRKSTELLSLRMCFLSLLPLFSSFSLLPEGTPSTTNLGSTLLAQQFRPSHNCLLLLSSKCSDSILEPPFGCTIVWLATRRCSIAVAGHVTRDSVRNASKVMCALPVPLHSWIFHGKRLAQPSTQRNYALLVAVGALQQGLTRVVKHAQAAGARTTDPDATRRTLRRRAK